MKRWKTTTFTQQQRTQYEIATNISILIGNGRSFSSLSFHFEIPLFKLQFEGSFRLRTKKYLIWSWNSDSSILEWLVTIIEWHTSKAKKIHLRLETMVQWPLNVIESFENVFAHSKIDFGWG